MAVSVIEQLSESLLEIFVMDLSYFEEKVPVAGEIVYIIIGVGWALLLGNLVFQALRGMMAGAGIEGEDPKILFLRTFIFSFLLLAARPICDVGLGLSKTVIQLLQVPDSVIIPDVGAGLADMPESTKWIASIIVGVVVIWQLVRLFLEIGERYVVVAVLTILSPLAFAMGGSKSTADIFKGWARMFGSMCLMLCLNVIFLKMLLSVIAVFPETGVALIPWLVLIIGLSRVGRKIDSIIARIGLNPAITGEKGNSMVTMMALRGLGRIFSRMAQNFRMPRVNIRGGRGGGSGGSGMGGGSPAPNAPTILPGGSLPFNMPLPKLSLPLPGGGRDAGQQPATPNTQPPGMGPGTPGGSPRPSTDSPAQEAPAGSSHRPGANIPASPNPAQRSDSHRNGGGTHGGGAGRRTDRPATRHTPDAADTSSGGSRGIPQDGFTGGNRGGGGGTHGGGASRRKPAAQAGHNASSVGGANAAPNTSNAGAASMRIGMIRGGAGRTSGNGAVRQSENRPRVAGIPVSPSAARAPGMTNRKGSVDTAEKSAAQKDRPPTAGHTADSTPSRPQPAQNSAANHPGARSGGTASGDGASHYSHGSGRPGKQGGNSSAPPTAPHQNAPSGQRDVGRSQSSPAQRSFNGGANKGGGGTGRGGTDKR